MIDLRDQSSKLFLSLCIFWQTLVNLINFPLHIRFLCFSSSSCASCSPLAPSTFHWPTPGDSLASNHRCQDQFSFPNPVLVLMSVGEPDQQWTPANGQTYSQLWFTIIFCLKLYLCCSIFQTWQLVLLQSISCTLLESEGSSFLPVMAVFGVGLPSILIFSSYAAIYCKSVPFWVGGDCWVTMHGIDWWKIVVKAEFFSKTWQEAFFRVRATGRQTRQAARAGDSDLGIELPNIIDHLFPHHLFHTQCLQHYHHPLTFRRWRLQCCWSDKAAREKPHHNLLHHLRCLYHLLRTLVWAF